jgi:hypothetical protein
LVGKDHVVAEQPQPLSQSLGPHQAFECSPPLLAEHAVAQATLDQFAAAALVVDAQGGLRAATSKQRSLFASGTFVLVRHGKVCL